ncbi:glycosyltransferase [Paenibacillus sp. BC26]|uniref:glycosyltransferase family 2 protein n=1 Tax=Paenibacillus sp. BC26 TaxID=1881032 RepID=UPI0008E0FDE4|nr:glycosyltransferase [Paenibacillus sp. BC26]SFT19715.1 Glycosyltransferase involved in cell wall bisynthesis [Paenibacillus sp. BC26]
MIDLGVVMPLYKQKPAFLAAALGSVLKQTFQQFKLIIVIDGAPEMEPLVRMLIQGDKRVQIVSHVYNQGVAKALNTGFQYFYDMPNIAYLTWVSSDNIYYPRFLETLRNALVKGPQELGLVYSSFQSVDNDGNTIYDEKMLAVQRQYQSQPIEKLLDSSLIGVSFMYKSIYAKQIDGYELVPVEDYDYWLRITEHCNIKYIPVELLDYRVNSTFSVSATLQSTSQHRIWRYAYHLARHHARMRRGIAPYMTILFPVKESSPEVIARIENLYEQTFSNYTCYILDLSPDMRVTADLSHISHPTTDFKWFPNANVATALLHAIQMVHTPYSYILGPRLFNDLMELTVLHNEMEKAAPELMSNYYTEDGSAVGYRHSSTHSGKAGMYDELFRRQSLVDYVKANFAQMSDPG